MKTRKPLAILLTLAMALGLLAAMATPASAAFCRDCNATGLNSLGGECLFCNGTGNDPHTWEPCIGPGNHDHGVFSVGPVPPHHFCDVHVPSAIHYEPCQDNRTGSGICDDCGQDLRTLPTSPVVKYQLVYNHGYFGSVVDVAMAAAGTAVDLSKNVPVRREYAFLGWSLTPDGKLIEGQKITVNGDTVVYAIWEQIDPLVSLVTRVMPEPLRDGALHSIAFFFVKYILFGWLWGRWL